MSEAALVESGFEFTSQTFSVSAADQARKLTCSGIDPELYNDAVDVAMLGLPTLRVMIACGIPILGGVHLTQRFRQIFPFRLGEDISISGRILEIAPHPRGCILRCEFSYAREDGTICVEAVRSGISPMGTKERSDGILRPSEDLGGFNEVMQRVLMPERVADYSSEAGNLIHSDPEVARKHGFRAPIAAGLMGIHFYQEALQKLYQPSTFDLEVWFRRPMFWDDTLTLVAHESHGRIDAMHLLTSEGKPASNCLVHSI